MAKNADVASWPCIASRFPTGTAADHRRSSGPRSNTVGVPCFCTDQNQHPVPICHVLPPRHRPESDAKSPRSHSCSPACSTRPPGSSVQPRPLRASSERSSRDSSRLPSRRGQAMIGGANPLASPLLGAPSPAGRRLATTASCASGTTSPALTPAAEPPAQSDSAPPPPRPDAPASPSPSSSRPLRASSQLSQWSRKRALRSGRRLGLASSASPVTKSSPPPKPTLPTAPPLLYDGAPPAWEDNDDDLCVAVGDASAGKVIYMVSDGTGWTAEHAVNAALGQFEHCLVDRDCTVNTHLFSGIDDEDRLLEVIKQAAKEGALVLYTLADPSMAESAKKACDFWSVPYTDLLGPTVDAIASHIGVAPSGIPRSSPSRQGGHLTEDYFRRIDAIDFTIKLDDGAQPQNLNRADIVLIGVSRTGKTPLSIYLAQKGYKVANVPIVMGVDLPKHLFEVDHEKIFGLTINPVILQSIRKARAKALGFDGHQTNYAEIEHVKQELAHAKKIFAQIPNLPVIEVTGKAIEETAAVIVRIYHDRKQKCSMPRISKRY